MKWLMLVMCVAILFSGCQSQTNNNVPEKQQTTIQSSNNILFRLEGITNFTYGVSTGSPNGNTQNQVVTYHISKQKKNYAIIATYTYPEDMQIMFLVNQNFKCINATHLASGSTISCDADTLFSSDLYNFTKEIVPKSGEYNFDEIKVTIDTTKPVPTRIIKQTDVDRTTYTLKLWK